MCNNHNLDFNNLNAYTFGKILSMPSVRNAGQSKSSIGGGVQCGGKLSWFYHLAVCAVWAKADKRWTKSQSRCSRWLRATVTNNWCIIYSHLKYGIHKSREVKFLIKKLVLPHSFPYRIFNRHLIFNILYVVTSIFITY